MLATGKRTPPSPAPESHPAKHRKDIDGLRAIAVGSVIINHINEKWMPLGNLGVDIFFVISGFVITLSLIKRTNQNLSSFLADFYSRRIKRLYPALLICVIVTSIAVICLAPRPYDSLNTGKMALLGLSNLYLYNIGTNYVADSARENAFLQTWSLGVEEQFYFIAPFLLWFTLKIRGRKSNSLAVGCFALLASLSLLLYYNNTKTDYWAAFFLLPSRFWELAIGVLTFLIIQKLTTSSIQRFASLKKIIESSATTIQGLALVALLITMFTNPDKSAPATLAVAALTSIFIAAGSFSQSKFILLSHPWVQWLGLTSYSLYLWHWSVLYVSRMLKISFTPINISVMVLTMLLLASLSYYLIEKPLRLAAWAPNSKRTLLKGFLLISGAIGFSTALQGFLLSWYPVQQKSFLKSRNWIGQSTITCHVERVNASTINDLISQCLKTTKAGPKAYVIGNSHAAQFLPTIEAALPSSNILRLTMWGCSYIPESQMNGNEKIRKGCGIYGSNVKDFFSNQLNKGDLVFLSYTVSQGLKTPDLTNHLADLAQVISRRGGHLIVFDDIYATTIQPEDCQPTLPMKLGLISKAKACHFQVKSAANFEALKEFDTMMQNLQSKGLLTYVRLRDFICPSSRCDDQQANGGFTFDFDNHLYLDAAVRIAPMLRQRLHQQNLL